MRGSLLWVTLGVLGVLEKGGHTNQNPHQPFQVTGGLLILLPMAAPIDPGATSLNPHHPVNMTWGVYNPDTRRLLNSISNIATKGTWWPELTFDLCVLSADINGFHCPSQLTSSEALSLGPSAFLAGPSRGTHHAQNRHCVCLSGGGRDRD